MHAYVYVCVPVGTYICYVCTIHAYIFICSYVCNVHVYVSLYVFIHMYVGYVAYTDFNCCS